MISNLMRYQNNPIQDMIIEGLFKMLVDVKDYLDKSESDLKKLAISKEAIDHSIFILAELKKS